MKLRRIPVSLLAVAFLTASSCVQAQVKPMTLSDYLHAALKSNPLLGSAEQSKAAAQYQSESIRKGYNPQLQLGSHLIIPPGYDPAITNGGEFGAQIFGSYTLLDGGVKKYEIEKGSYGVESGALNQKRTRADIIYSVSVAFVAAVKEKRELDVLEEGHALLKNYLQLVEQLHASGQGSEADILKTTVDLNNAEINIDAKRMSLENSLLALAQAAALPAREVTDVDTSIVGVSYDTTFMESRSIDLASQRLMLKQARIEAQIADARLAPTVSVVADAGALASLPTYAQGLANVFGASVGISVSVPFLTTGSIKDQYKAAEANANSVSLQNDYNRNSLEQEFTTTKNYVMQARSQIASLKKNLVVANQNLLLSRARYASGSGLSLDVLDAIQMVNQIRLAIEEARAQMEMNALKLNRLNYTGAN